MTTAGSANAPSSSGAAARQDASAVADRLGLPVAALADLCRRHGIIELSLFGSALRDDFGPSSDYDLLVTFDPAVRIGFMGLGRIEQDLEAVLGRPVDVIPSGGLKPRIRGRVLADAVVLYAGPG
jgi:predicted nucleotidyltransferase